MSNSASSNSVFLNRIQTQAAEQLSKGKSQAVQIKNRILASITEYLKRREMRPLLKQSAEHLADMGVTRDQLHRSLSLPLSKSASSWLKANKIDKI